MRIHMYSDSNVDNFCLFHFSNKEYVVKFRATYSFNDAVKRYLNFLNDIMNECSDSEFCFLLSVAKCFIVDKPTTRLEAEAFIDTIMKFRENSKMKDIIEKYIIIEEIKATEE